MVITITPRLIGAVARSVEGTNTGHKNDEAMASIGVRVERLVRRQLSASQGCAYFDNAILKFDAEVCEVIGVRAIRRLRN